MTQQFSTPDPHARFSGSGRDALPSLDVSGMTPIETLVAGIADVKRRLPIPMRKVAMEALSEALRLVIADQVAIMRQATAADAAAQAKVRDLMRREAFVTAKITTILRLLDEGARLNAIPGAPTELFTEIIADAVAQIRSLTY